VFRTGLAGLLAALVVVAGCGGDGDGGGDFVRFTSSDVQAHYQQQTRFELVRVAKGQAEDLLKPRPSPAANDRYGFFTVHVTKQGRRRRAQGDPAAGRQAQDLRQCGRRVDGHN